MAAALVVNTVATQPYDGQKTGTSGLRKKTKIFMQPNYLANWIQSLFNALGDECRGKVIGLGGDGRFFNKEAVQIIIKLAAGNGLQKVLVGRDGIMATPAMSALIRRRKLYGGIIMSASHNAAGPDEDWGIKFNYSAGEPAPEKITDKIFGFTQNIRELRMADIPDVDLNKLGSVKFGDFEVEVIDFTEDYFAVLRSVFDFDALRRFVTRGDGFKFAFDAMCAVTGAYAYPLFVDALGASPSCIRNGTPLQDFGGGHPDPNLTYAKDLVAVMYAPDAPAFGAASDGDGDRNMILGDHFFVTPSDSVAIIAANAQQVIPYFKGGLKGVARSMPTSGALDRVAAELKIPFFETPTGWKYFGNLMDSNQCSICGEESFGTGSEHVREKDGLWAVLAWLSLLAHKNAESESDAAGAGAGGAGSSKAVSVRDVVLQHWARFGRNVYSRHDFEGVDSDAANRLMQHLENEYIAKQTPGQVFGAPDVPGVKQQFKLALADNFRYVDPVDGSVAANQGIRFVFECGSRFVFRLSGTGSSGATIRLYVETYTKDSQLFEADAQKVLADTIATALFVSKLAEFTGRNEPTVIT